MIDTFFILIFSNLKDFLYFCLRDYLIEKLEITSNKKNDKDFYSLYPPSTLRLSFTLYFIACCLTKTWISLLSRLMKTLMRPLELNFYLLQL